MYQAIDNLPKTLRKETKIAAKELQESMKAAEKYAQNPSSANFKELTKETIEATQAIDELAAHELNIID